MLHAIARSRVASLLPGTVHKDRHVPQGSGPGSSVQGQGVASRDVKNTLYLHHTTTKKYDKLNESYKVEREVRSCLYSM